jgi:hypothetical protein
MKFERLNIIVFGVKCNWRLSVAIFFSVVQMADDILVFTLG